MEGDPLPLREIAEAAKAAGFNDAKQRKRLLQEPTAGLSDEFRQTLTPQLLQEAVAAIIGRQEQYHYSWDDVLDNSRRRLPAAAQLGSLLYEYGLVAGEGDRKILSVEDKRLVGLVVHLLQRSFYSGKLVGLDSHNTASIAFLANRLAKILDAPENQDIAGTNSAQLVAFTQSVGEFAKQYFAPEHIEQLAEENADQLRWVETQRQECLAKKTQGAMSAKKQLSTLTSELRALESQHDYSKILEQQHRDVRALAEFCAESPYTREYVKPLMTVFDEAKSRIHGTNPVALRSVRGAAKVFMADGKPGTQWLGSVTTLEDILVGKLRKLQSVGITERWALEVSSQVKELTRIRRDLERRIQEDIAAKPTLNQQLADNLLIEVPTDAQVTQRRKLKGELAMLGVRLPTLERVLRVIQPFTEPLSATSPLRQFRDLHVKRQSIEEQLDRIFEQTKQDVKNLDLAAADCYTKQERLAVLLRYHADMHRDVIKSMFNSLNRDGSPRASKSLYLIKDVLIANDRLAQDAELVKTNLFIPTNTHANGYKSITHGFTVNGNPNDPRRQHSLYNRLHYYPAHLPFAEMAALYLREQRKSLSPN